MTRVLVTGFEPFDGGKTNPSQMVAKALDGAALEGFTILGRVLPVEFATVPGRVAALLDEIRPDIVIGCGLSAGDTAIRLEWFASNRMESARADNVGVAPDSQPIDIDGPAVRQSTIDLQAVSKGLKAAKIPMRLSFNAGSHCCNLMLYTALGVIEDRGWSAQAAFVHLPPEAALPVETMVEAVKIAISMAGR